MAEGPSPSLLDRTIAHRRSIWATLGLVLLIYLPTVRQQLPRAFHLLLERMQNREPRGNHPWEVKALVAYERELQEANTWPYNPAILRTLVVSVLLPVATDFARRVFEVYIQ